MKKVVTAEEHWQPPTSASIVNDTTLPYNVTNNTGRVVTQTDNKTTPSTTTPHKAHINTNPCKGATNKSTTFSTPTPTPRPPRTKRKSPDSVELGKFKEELRLLKVVHQSALEHIEKQNKSIEIELKDHEET